MVSLAGLWLKWEKGGKEVVVLLESRSESGKLPDILMH